MDSKKSDPAAQYATTLSTDLWDPSAFPNWAFKGPLRRSQSRVQKERARTAGEPMDFVKSGGSGTGTPVGGSGVGGKRKTRFDS